MELEARKKENLIMIISTLLLNEGVISDDELVNYHPVDFVISAKLRSNEDENDIKMIDLRLRG